MTDSKRCILCGLEKSILRFPKESPICNKCVQRLQDEYEVDYSPPQRLTLREANIKLLHAVRRNAIEEDDLDTFEDYWLREPNMVLMWDLLKNSSSSSSALGVIYKEAFAGGDE